MKVKILTGIFGVILALSSAMGETVTATSNTFTFPALSGIKDGRFVTKAATFFRNSGYSPKSGVVTFAWSVPDQMKAGKGSIAIYSMLGRMVKTIPINASMGVETWKASKLGGVYVAKLVFGSNKQNLKLIFCK
jgi:hypothetical protein